MANAKVLDKLRESKNSGRKVIVFLTSGEEIIGEVLEMRFYLGIKNAAKKVIILMPCRKKGEGRRAKEVIYKNIAKVMYAKK